MTIKIQAVDCDNFEEAWLLLVEYFEQVQVIVRDEKASLFANLTNKQSFLWLAYADGLLCGCILLRPLRLASNAAAGEVKRLYVKHDHRKKGIAGFLLSTLESRAAELKLTELYLDTKDDLTSAIRFYEQAGYLRCERYNNNPQASLFMKKALF